MSTVVLKRSDHAQVACPHCWEQVDIDITERNNQDLDMKLRDGETMEAGLQPLDALMDRHRIANHELVEISDLHLTHKEVQKARKGRRLTARTQRRVLAALQARLPEERLTPDDLFTYRGR